MKPAHARPPRGARRALVAFALVLPLVLALAGAAVAQEGGVPAPPPDSTGTPAPPPPEPQSLQPVPAPATPAPASPVPLAPGLRAAPAFTWGDSTGLVLPPLADVRSSDELAADLAAARTLRASAENRMLKARERSVRWKAQVEIQKSREATLKKQIDAAKKEKREGDRKDFEAQKKREELTRGYYESMREALEAEAEFHKAAFDYAQARIDAAELEKRLGERWAGGGYDGRVASEARSLEQRVLSAVKDRADRMSNYASREKTLAEKRAEALKEWGALQR